MIIHTDKAIYRDYGRFTYERIFFLVMKSRLQKKLERQGCVFTGQERLDNHEPDPDKPCKCGRPLK